MTKEKVRTHLLMYLILSGISYFIAVGGDTLYFSLREMQFWSIYHALFGILFGVASFFHYNAKFTRKTAEKAFASTLFLSLFLLLIVLGYISTGTFYSFHTLVPFSLRMFYLSVEISLLFMTIYMFIGMFMGSVKAIKEKEQQES